MTTNAHLVRGRSAQHLGPALSTLRRNSRQRLQSGLERRLATPRRDLPSSLPTLREDLAQMPARRA